MASRSGPAAGIAPSHAASRGAAPGRSDLSPGSLAALARQAYRFGSLPLRLLQHYRPYLCPFDRLIPFVPPGATILDVGCGSALFLALVDELGLLGAGIGMDASPAAIAVARAMAAGRSPDRSAVPLEFLQLDVTSAAWPAGPFRVVAMIDLLHHLPITTRRDVVARAATRVAEDGILLIKDMGSSPRWMAAANTAHDAVLARQLVRYTPMSLVDEWAAREGLRCLQMESPHRLWYPHEVRVYGRGS